MFCPRTYTIWAPWNCRERLPVSTNLKTNAQDMLIADSSTSSNVQNTKRGGPPNRMNDLAYRDWMKFQKSFFRYSSDQSLIEECIYFFTKAVWGDGSPSQTLVVGAANFFRRLIPPPRAVTHDFGQKSFEAVRRAIHSRARTNGAHDFVLVDLRRLIRVQAQLDEFVNRYAEDFFGGLREALGDGRYCCVMVEFPRPGAGGFPFPWAVALAARSHLRLRDEKISLVEDGGRVFYCLFMQAIEDGRSREIMTSKNFRLSEAKLGRDAPAWIIPKPPPRKKNEIFHPAKFPETLIEELIRIHSSAGDNVFDPMVGTGSAVLAAMRAKRRGYGTDLSEDFIRIAQDRIDQELAPSLFPDPKSEGQVFVGDATKLDEIRELDGIQFQYAVTSPPYWSMLTNPGNENQKARRKRNLPLVYSDDPRDLGNIGEYDKFLSILESVYNDVAKRLAENGMLTVVAKNVKRNHVLHTLAWDLACRLCGPQGSFNYVGTTLWCQDNVGIKPFAVGIHWVSNILHTYCLHFEIRKIT